MGTEWKWNGRQKTPDGYEVETTFDSGSQGDAKPPEFGSFEKLTRKLVSVPKSEVDEQREKS